MKSVKEGKTFSTSVCKLFCTIDTTTFSGSKKLLKTYKYLFGNFSEECLAGPSFAGLWNRRNVETIN